MTTMTIMMRKEEGRGHVNGSQHEQRGDIFHSDQHNMGNSSMQPVRKLQRPAVQWEKNWNKFHRIVFRHASLKWRCHNVCGMVSTSQRTCDGCANVPLYDRGKNVQFESDKSEAKQSETQQLNKPDHRKSEETEGNQRKPVRKRVARSQPLKCNLTTIPICRIASPQRPSTTHSVKEKITNQSRCNVRGIEQKYRHAIEAETGFQETGTRFMFAAER